jgi:capsular polysaccharide transport system ATP-binding protein
MIILDRVTKYYPTPSGRHYVLRDVSLTVPLGRNIGVIGRNGAGKSTLLRIMAGVDYPNTGKVTRIGSYSWPLALAGRGVQGTMTGRENVVFAARIHGMRREEIERLIGRVEAFTELGDFFDMPVGTYSSGMRARLSFSIAMLFEFDCYFIDELNAVGDARFRRLTREYFEQSRKTATFIQVSHDLKDLHQICDAGLLVNDGRVTFFEYVDEAIQAYRDIVGNAGDFDENEDEVLPEAPEAVPVAVPVSRQARRAAALARRRRRQREAAIVAPAAAGGATVAMGTTEDGASPGRRKARRKQQRARRRARDSASVPASGQETEAPPRRAARRVRKSKGKQSVIPMGLSPARQLAMKKTANRRNKSNQKSRGQD